MTKNNACFGSIVRIRNAPTKQPMNAPKMGISAVKAINTPTRIAKGKRKTVIATKNIKPNITASRHCPVRKFVKIR